jgi:ubiquinone/menaquinone biosynthesis C-methylase UbiE
MTDPRTREIELYAHRHPQLPRSRPITPLLATALEHSAGIVLDIGCGEGLTLHAAASKGRVQCIGLEYSLTRAQTAIDADTPLALGDALELPINDSSIGLVISRHVIEHLSDDRRSLREVHRVLRPNGLLYLETPIRRLGAWYWYRNAQGRRVLDPTHVREYAHEDMVATLISETGLTVLTTNVVPLRYPLVHVAHRSLRALHPTARPFVRLLERPAPTIRIPRYAELRLLARLPDSTST